MKKHNPDPEQLLIFDKPADPQTDEPAPPPVPPELPEFRSYIVRSYDAETGKVTERAIHVNGGFDFGEDGMVAFMMYFVLPNGQLVQVPRYTFARTAWEEIEEVRTDYPERVTN